MLKWRNHIDSISYKVKKINAWNIVNAGFNVYATYKKYYFY